MLNHQEQCFYTSQGTEKLPESALSEVIDAIGTPQFGFKLLGYLNSFCQVDHCAAYHIESDSVRGLATGSLDGTDAAERKAGLYTAQHHWRRDPVLQQARAQLAQADFSIVHGDIRDIADSGFRKAIFPHVNDRVFVSRNRQEIALGLSVLRSDSNVCFSNDELVKLNESAELLMSLLAKHANVIMSRPNVVGAITCLEEIEDCLITMTQFPKREIEVCSRVLRGMSSIGIALDLGIGEETVKTYRKRSYQRLLIGSERELLTWYLDLWSTWRGLSYIGPARQHRPKTSRLMQGDDFIVATPVLMN